MGAMALEPLYLHSGLRELPKQMGIDADDKIHGLKQLVAKIHETDTKVIAHLNHPGRMANPKIPGNYFVSSVALACENGGAVPEALNNMGIAQVIRQFVDAAIRAGRAGFDIIELQFGHGYLVSQFLSPKVNKRNDAYGGSFENRIRLAIEILKTVKSAVQLPIIVRISGDEMIPDGIKMDEMIDFAVILKQIGIEALHVSAGTVCNTPPWYFQHMFVPKGKTWDMARQLKEATGLPIIFVGQVNTKEDVDALNNTYKADYIAIGRALVADPEFVLAVSSKETKLYKPCLDCSQGCLGGVKSGRGLECLVNPMVGMDEIPEPNTKKSWKVAIVGGGLSGMEAALNLDALGHQVSLYENKQLGGQFNLASKSPKKDSMEKLVTYYLSAIDASGIKVIPAQGTPELLNDYEQIVLATGSTVAVPPIEGLKEFYWAEILNKEHMPRDKKVLVIGGGLVGIDVSAALVAHGNKVIITKRTDDFGGTMEPIAKKLSLQMLEAHQTVFSNFTHIQKIEGRTAYGERNGESIRFDGIDHIVIATGMKSNLESWQSVLENKKVHVIGDAHQVGDAQSAIKDAYLKVMAL